MAVQKAVISVNQAVMHLPTNAAPHHRSLALQEPPIGCGTALDLLKFVQQYLHDPVQAATGGCS